jgi:membrane protease YdiL (CAAX protease family)
MIRRHPLAAFFLLAYAISWLLWLPSVVGAGGIAGVLFILGGFGPMLAALIVLRLTGGSVRDWARQIVRWRVAPRFYAYALGLPILLLAVVNVELALLGRSIDLGLLAERLPAYAWTFAFVAVLGGGFEEPGWRGFALPRLQRRHHPVVATLLLGLGWSLWHLPVYGLSFLGPMLFVFFYTWLYNQTGSVLLCILLHAGFTPALEQLILVPGWSYGTFDVVALAVAGTLAAAAAVLVGLTRGRLGQPAPADALAR